MEMRGEPDPKGITTIRPRRKVVKAASAYVLIEAAAGRIHGVMDGLSKIQEVKSCDLVTGQYDIIARIEADDIDVLGRAMCDKILMIDGVLRTITCNVINRA